MGNLTHEQKGVLKRKAMDSIKKALLEEKLAVIKEPWEIRITKRADEYFEITGRMSSLTVYLTETNSGYLVSVPSEQRCGHVPADCNQYDIENYVGLENDIDATTLATGVRWLIQNGHAANI
ncbi:hypothetical protein V6C27_13710 [Peptococcaceae bacterium 1198_IL3148]